MVVLPSWLHPVEEDDCEETESDDEQESPVKHDPKILDNAAEILHNITKGLVFDGFEVNSVPVKCDSDEVSIKGKSYNNGQFQNFDKIQNYYMGKTGKGIQRKKDPRMTENSNFIHKHLDRRIHSLFFRKCHSKLDGKVCSYCKKNPTRASDSFWNDLPSRKRGGLFFGVQPDPENPDHNLTYLQLIQTKNLQIKPDSEF